MKPLDGVRVLDLSRLLPGPLSTQILADLGASVDKVEDPRAGDYARVLPVTLSDGMSPIFHALNRGKRSLVLDLKTEVGRDAFLQILPNYDVLLDGFRPGVMDRLGLSEATLRERHPKLILCAMTGYGQTGPLAPRAGHDLGYESRAGILGLTGPTDRPPQVPGVQVADIGGSLYAVIGILAALRQRDQTGEGSTLDISLSDAATTFALFGLTLRAGGLDFARGEDVLAGGIAPYRTYATKDGKHVSLAALEPKFFMRFCAGAGLDFDPNALVPGPQQVEWIARLTEVFATRTRDEWTAFADEHDCCLEPITSPAELLEDEHLLARGLLIEQPLRDGATVRTLRTPAAEACEGVAPRQGEHTAEILREGGLSDEEIAKLTA